MHHLVAQLLNQIGKLQEELESGKLTEATVAEWKNGLIAKQVALITAQIAQEQVEDVVQFAAALASRIRENSDREGTR